MNEAIKEEAVKEVKPKAQKKYKLTVHSEAEGGDTGDVLIGHNFKLIQIKRNIEVIVDECFVNVLKGSVIDTMVKGEDDKMHPVKIPRYSYSVEPV